jgi:hypothetical protein
MTETLLASLLFVVTLSGAYQIFHHGLGVCNTATQQETAHVELAIVRNHWRAFARASQPTTWRADGSRFTAGADTVRAEGDRLHLTRADRTESLALPPRANCVFTVEKAPGLADCAVLAVTWSSRDAAGRTQRHEARWVACANPAAIR